MIGAAVVNNVSKPVKAAKTVLNIPAPVERAVSAQSWADMLVAMELGGAARQLASNCSLVARDGALLRLSLDSTQQMLRTPALVERLAQALTRHLGEAIRLEIAIGRSDLDTPARTEERSAKENLEAARRSLDADSTVRAFKETFGATLKPDSVKSLKS